MIGRGTTTVRAGAFFGTLLAFTFTFTALKATSSEAQQGGSKPVKANAARAASKLPSIDYGFIENKGQWDDEAQFYTGMRGLDVWVTRSGIVYDFYKSARPSPKDRGKMATAARQGHVVDLQFLGAQKGSGVRGIGERDGVVNYVRAGSSFSGVKTFNETRVEGLYRGVDLRVYRDNGQPRFDMIVAPGADPSSIHFKYAGASSVKPSDKDTLLVGTRFGDVTVSDLYAYQTDASGQRQIDCRFDVQPDGTVKFAVGNYDKSKPLIIDPVVWSTLLGAPFGDDFAWAVAVDSFNNPYVTGQTNAPSYPVTSGAYDISRAGVDAFVTKMTTDASGLVYSTFIGGSGADQGFSIAVDSQLRAYVTGATNSTNFPVTPGAPQVSYGGNPSDAFVVRLSPSGGQLEFGTYLGASVPNDPFAPGDVGNDIAVDAVGNIYVGGQTPKADFPTTGFVRQPIYGGGSTDGFLTKIGSNGVLSYSTFIGGAAGEAVTGVAVDVNGYAYTTGSTASADLGFRNNWLTSGSFDQTVQGSDAFVIKVNPSGTEPDYGTVIGGSGGESSAAIALDSQGNAYICGASTSVDFPRTPGAFDNVFSPDQENFVTKISIDGSSLVYSTFMNGGGSQTDIGVDDLGVAYISGYVLGAGITTTATGDDTSYNGPPPAPGRIGDAFLQALDEAGSSLLYGSYFGGEEDDAALGIAIDRSRNAFIVGVTNSWTEGQKVAFPTTPGVFKPTMSHDNIPNPLPFYDAFVMKIKVRPAPLIQTFTISPNSVAGSERATATITLSGPPSPGGATIRIRSSNESVARATDGNGNVINSVFIPENAPAPFTTTFTIETSDVVQAFVVNFTVELEGDTKSASLTVAPWLTNLTLSPNQIVGGNRGTGRVTLFRPAPAGGLTVSVSSSDTTRAFPVDENNQQINSFVVPAGQTSATFDIRTRGVDSPINVTFLARITNPNLAVTRSQVLRILPASLRSVSFNPSRVNGGFSSVGTVTLNGEAGPSGINARVRLGNGTAPITLKTSPSDPGGPSIDIRVLPFTTSRNFIAETGNVSQNSFRNIVAERTNGEQASGTLFVDAISIQSIELSSSSVLGGTVVYGHVNLSGPASSAGFTVTLSSSDNTYARLNTTSVRVPPGAIRSETFRIDTPLTNQGATVTITASGPQGYTPRTAQLTIRPINMNFTMNPATVVGGSQNSTGIISLNEPAPTGGVPVGLTSSNPNVLAVQSVVTIPAGQQQASFTATSRSVTQTTTSTVTARINTIPTPITRSQTVTVTPLTVTLTLNPATVTGGSQNSTATATISAPAGPNGLVLTLSSSNTAVATVPSSVTVPSGQTSVTFTVRTSMVATDPSLGVTISARTPAGISGSARLTVLPLRVGVSINPDDVTGGQVNPAGSVVLSTAAGEGGVVVNLTSNNPQAAQVSSSVRIPAGQISQQFTVITNRVANDTTVTITATLPSGRQGGKTLIVRSARVTDLTVSPGAVIGGDSAIGRVTTSVNSPSGGINVMLSTNDPNVAQVPATVNVPAGTRTGNFTITTSPVADDVNISIFASYPTGVTRSASLLVLAPSLVSLTITPSQVTGGQTATGTITINRPAPAGGITVTLEKDPNATGSPFVQIPATVTIPQGQRSANFTIRTTVPSRTVGTTIFAKFSPRGQQVSATITVERP